MTNGVEKNEARNGAICPNNVQKLPLMTLVVIPLVERVSSLAGELAEEMLSKNYNSKLLNFNQNDFCGVWLFLPAIFKETIVFPFFYSTYNTCRKDNLSHPAKRQH